MSKIKLPDNASVALVDRDADESTQPFYLLFVATADGLGDYQSDVYSPFEDETVEDAALRICEKFDWIDHPPATPHAHRIIHNLAEFLEWRGFSAEEPYTWARCFYKYTDCGPWAAFWVRDREESIYYEDLRREKGDYIDVPCSCCIEAGLPHPDDPQEESTTTKGPEPECELCYGHGTLRRWQGTGQMEATLDPDTCEGIQFGSIVEGSEVCSGPFDHMFPFNSMDFSKDEKRMEEETSYFWERDNSDWYRVDVRNNTYYVHNTWGEIKWDDAKPSRKLQKKIEDFLNTEEADEIPHEPNAWGRPQPDYKPLRIPGTLADICEYTNDTDF